MPKHREQQALEDVIKRHIARHERSLQTAVGPSELGTPCDRRLALKMLGAEEVNVRPSADWRPTVGTAVHTWLAGAMEAENERLVGLGQEPRFLVEQHLPVGRVNGTMIYGHLDVYDRDWPGIVDWKIVGVTTLRTVRRLREVNDTYRVQQHLYGRGVARAMNLPVEHVACMFLPSSGTLNDAVFWTEPFDMDFADSAIARVRKMQAEVDDPDDLDKFIRGLPTTFDHCGHCPFFDPSATARQWKRCSGDPAMAARHPTDLTDLLD